MTTMSPTASTSSATATTAATVRDDGKPAGRPTAGRSVPLVFVYCLNILSCFAVVLLHTTLPVYGPTPTHLWMRMAGLQALAIFAVPIFFMISGMNLLGYRDRYSTETFFRKRLWRVGRAILLGSVVCYLLYGLFSSSFYGADSFIGKYGIVDFVKRFLTNQINDTYWFFYSIIYLYVLTPVLSLVVKNRRCVEYMLALTALVAVAFPLAERFHLAPAYVNTLFGWPLFSSISLLYFLAGYYFHVYWKPVRYQAAFAGTVFVLCVIGMTWMGLRSNDYGHAGAYDSYYAGITSPLCVLQTLALFLLFQSLEPRLQNIPAKAMQWLKLVSGASLGVYLFHILVINWIHPDVLSRVLGKLSSLPFLKAVVVYAAVAVAVMAGKWLIARIKRLYHGRAAD